MSSQLGNEVGCSVRVGTTWLAIYTRHAVYPKTDLKQQIHVNHKTVKQDQKRQTYCMLGLLIIKLNTLDDHCSKFQWC